MRLSLLPRLLLPLSMLTLVSCTLVVNSALDTETGTGLGSGVVNVEDDGGSPLGTCTITNGVPQADCEQWVQPNTTIVLKPVAGAGSEFGGWTASGLSVPPVSPATLAIPCDVLAGDNCTIVFDNPLVSTVNITASFKRLSCQGTDACTDLASQPPGEGSCKGTDACFSAAGPIGNNSCVGNSACAYVYKPIGNNSCNGGNACYVTLRAIGDNSCNGPEACSEAAFFVGDYSCNTTGNACRDATGPIGDCMYNDVTPAACVDEPEEP